jgi:uncharacterized protein YdeI (YjbR/CyaY-like superfamily)
MALPDLPVRVFASADDFERWLDEHHATEPGLGLKMAKKASGIPSVNHDEAVEVALCFGWIDGQAKSVDDEWWVQRFTPRRPRSNWSKRNCATVERLIAAGRMRPAGLAEVEAAKADGRWAGAYDGPRTMTVPDDLQLELDRKRRAKEFWDTLDSRNRYAMLYRIQDAKRAETRARRIAQFVAMLDDQTKLYP